MSMHHDDRLIQLLSELFVQFNINCIFESGTYEGLGSSQFLAKLLSKQVDPRMVTVEANYHSWKKAKSNLEKYGFIKPLWGNTLFIDRCVQFIESDQAIFKHELYPDIYIDDLDNPSQFYLSEIKGQLGSPPGEEAEMKADRENYYQGEGIIDRELSSMKKNCPLVLLDSAGGIGYLEFQTVMDTLKGETFFLLLDDTHHLKHFRSLKDIQANSSFELLGHCKDLGWALAYHKP